MEDNKLQKGIEELKKITMTADEKERVFEYVVNSPVKAKRIISPLSFDIFISVVKRYHLAYYVVVPLIIVLASGGIVFASEEVLPTSILYPVKVSIVEPVRGALTFSAKAKAYYESDLAIERLIEAEKLATLGKLDADKEKQINGLIDNHSKKLGEAISKIDQTKEVGKVDEIVVNFEAEMNAHAKVLDIITAEQKSKTEEQKPEAQQAPQVSEQVTTEEEVLEPTLGVPEMRKMDVVGVEPTEEEPAQEDPTQEENVSDANTLMFSAKMIMSGPTELENEVSKSARMNADKISSQFKNKENNRDEIKNVEVKENTETENKKDQYNKRKDDVKSSINRAIDNLNKVGESSREGRKEIIEKTNTTLEEAILLLDEASKKEETGDLNEAYNTLLDSESSAKEAGIFLEAGLKIEKKN